MSELKSLAKLGAINDMGVKLDDQLDKYNQEQLKLAGGLEALKAGARAVEAMLVHVDKDVEEKKVEPGQAIDYAKLYVGRCAAALANMARQAEAKMLIAQGKIEAQMAAVAVAKAQYDVENRQLEALKNAPANPTSPQQRAVGQHPAPPLKVVRAAIDGGSSPAPAPKKKAKKAKGEVA